MADPIKPILQYYQPPKVLGGLSAAVQAQLSINQGSPTGIVNGYSMEEIQMANKIALGVPTYGLESPWMSARKYDDDVLGYDSKRDNEDLYAQNQGWGSQLGAGLGRLVTTTLTKIGSSLGYIAAGIGNTPEFFNGDKMEDGFTKWIAATSDNTFSKWFETLEDDIKIDYLPVFQDAADRDKGFFSRALTDLNFWTDEFTDGLAFMASAWVPGLTIAKLGGIGSLAKATSIINSARTARNIDVGLTTLLNTTAESFWEANETKKAVSMGLQGKINPSTGIEYTPSEIKSIAAHAAKDTFSGNMIALALSNLWETNLMFKRLPSKSGASGVEVTSGILGKATVPTVSTGKRIAGNIGKGIGIEGFWEENIQLAIQRYNEAGYDPTASNVKYSKSILENYLQQTAGAIMGEDKEAAMAIGLGGILGGIVGGIMQTKADSQKDKFAQQAAMRYNNAVDAFKKLGEVYKIGEDGSVSVDEQRVKQLIAGNQSLYKLQQRMERANEVGEQSLINFYENEAFTQFALAHFEMGMGDTLISKLTDATKITDDDLMLIGYNPASRTEAAQKMVKLSAKAKQLEQLYNDIEGNVFSKDEDINNFRKRKLFELGSREQMLEEEIQNTELALGSISALQPIEIGSVNQLVARVAALKKKQEGITKMMALNEVPEWVEGNEIEKKLAAAEKQLEEYKETNKESLKVFKQDAEGFYEADQTYNALQKQKLKDFTEKSEMLKLSLEDTRTKFNRIFDAKKGEKYFSRYILSERLRYKPEEGEDFTAEDKSNLNDKLTVELEKPEYDEIVGEFPMLLDPDFPINLKLDILRKLNKPEILPLIERFRGEISSLAEAITKRKTVEAENRAKEKKIEEDKAYQERINLDAEKIASESESVEEEVPPGLEVAGEGKLKDITNIASTSDPAWDETSEGNFHRTHQQFLFNLTQKDFPNKGSVRVILITRANQGAYGFENWITNTSENPDDAVIRTVYVSYKDGVLQYLDVEGKLIGKVGEKPPAGIVFSQLTSTNLQFPDGNRRYTNKEGYDEAAYTAWWRETRSKILAKTEQSPVYSIGVSRGHPKETGTEDNSVVKAGLVTEEEFYKPLVQISTVGRFHMEGEISSSATGVNIPTGRIALSSGGNLVHLDNHNLTEDQVDQVYRLLLAMVSSSEKLGHLDSSIAKIFLNHILHFSQPQKGKEPSRSQIWIKSGLRTKDWSIPFNSVALQREEKTIKDFLRKAYHNVNNVEINKQKSAANRAEMEFSELDVNTEGKVYTKHKWPSYNHYLLSETAPDGKSRSPVLTTNIEKPSDAPTIVGKYSVLISEPFTHSPKKAEPKKAEPKPKKEKKEVSVYTTKQGHKISYTGTGSNIQLVEDDQLTLSISHIKGLAPVIKLHEKNPEVTIEEVATGFLRGIIIEKTKPKEIKPEATVTQTPEEIRRAAQKLLDEAPPEPDEMNTRVVVEDIIPFNYTKADIEAEIAWFRERFPGIPVHRYTHLIKLTSGGLAWGMFKGGALHIYNEAEVGTVYHEAFETVWNAYLTPQEQVDIFNEFTAREGSFKTYRGEYKTFSAATAREAKEQLSEEFRDFKLGEKKPKERSILAFFKGLIKFIEELFLGPQSKVNELFERIERGAYKNSRPLAINRFEEYPREISRDVPERVIQDAIEGMTAVVFGEVFKENVDLVNQLEENVEHSAKELYEKLYTGLEREFTRNIPSTYRKAIEKATPEQAAFLQEELGRIVLGDGKEGNSFGWQYIKDNWEAFVTDHKASLKKYAGEFYMDEEGSVRLRDDIVDINEVPERGYDYDIFKINAKNAASTFVKLLIGSLSESEYTSQYIAEHKANKPADLQAIKRGAESGKHIQIRRSNSVLRLPRLVNYSKLFNYILHNVAGSDSIYSIADKLAKLAQNANIGLNASVYRLLNRLNFSNNFQGKTLGEIKGLLKVEGALMKQKPDFYGQYYTKDKGVTIRSTDLTSTAENIKNEWVANLAASKAAEVNKHQIKFKRNIPNIDSTDVKGVVAFLNNIGIKITVEQLYSLPNEDSKIILEQASALKRVIKENAGKTLKLTSGKGVDINGRYKKIADIYVKKITGEDSEGMHNNMDNELTSNFVLNNYVSTILNNAHDSQNREEFEGYNPWFNKETGDIWFKGSTLIDKMFSGGTVRLGVSEGRVHEGSKNRTLKSLSEGERLLHDFNNNISGLYSVLLPADSKTEWIINPGQYIDASKYFNTVTRDESLQKFYNYMYATLAAEVELARDYENRKHVVQLTERSGGRIVGKSLRFFKNILSEGAVEMLHTKVIDKQGNLGEVLPMESFIEEMRAYLTQRVNKTRATLEREGFVRKLKGQERIKINGFITTFIKNHFGRNDYLGTNELYSLIAYREMNYIMNNIEMHRTFFGDPAVYKDEVKRIKSFMSGRENTHVDFLENNQGLNQALSIELNKNLLPGDIGYHEPKNHLNAITLFDVTISSAQLAEIQEAIGEAGSTKYTKINEADAQSWISPTAYREFMLKSRRWMTNQEHNFQWHMAYERVTKGKPIKGDQATLDKGKLPGVYFPVIKPIGSGVSFENGVANINLDKTSTAPLFYEWVEGREMERVYNVMQEKGIDYVRMESAHKVGMSSTSTTSLYNADNDINTNAIKNLVSQKIPFRFFGIQVETGNKKDEQTEGSQIRKVAVGDLMRNGVPIDVEMIEEEWEELTWEEKVKASPVYRKIYNQQTAEADLTRAHYKKALAKLGLEDTGSGFIVSDPEKVRSFILNEVTRMELPKNISDAIASGTMNYEALPNYKQIKDIIYSVIDKQILRPKVSGSSKVLQSITGWHKVKREKVNGKDVLVSSELAFYKRKVLTTDKEGKKVYGTTLACEIYLPYWFGKELADSNSQRSKEEVIKYLNDTVEGQKLLNGVGFRIPTQNFNSIEHFVVKNFLPEDMGDTVIFPSEITTKAGSDFDVDKMNIYLKNFFINKQGYPQAYKFETFDTTSEQALRDYYERNLLHKYRFFKGEEEKFISKSNVAGTKLLEVIGSTISELGGIKPEEQNLLLSEEEKAELDRLSNLYVPSVDEFIATNKGLPIEEVNSIEALENRYFDTLMELIDDPNNYGRLVTPNSTEILTKEGDGLKNYAEKIANLTGRRETESAKLNYSSMLDSSYMNEQRTNFSIGDLARGIAVTSVTSHIFAQLSGTYVDVAANSLPFDVNVREISDAEGNVTEKISIAGTTDAEGRFLISTVLSQIVDGFVDVAKGAWLIEMGVDNEQAKNFIMMLKMGIHPYRAGLFLNQPVIRQYIEAKRKSDSVAAVTGEARISAYQIKNDILSQYQVNKDYNKPSKYAISEMEEMIRNTRDGKKLSKDQQQLQRYMLADFEKIDDLAWDMYWFTTGFQYDVNRINNPAIARGKFFATEDITNTKIIGAENIFKNTYMGAYKDAVRNMHDALAMLFKMQQGRNGAVMEKISRDMYFRRGVQKAQFQRLVGIAETNMLNFFIHTNTDIAGRTLNSYIEPLMINKEGNVGKYILAMKDHENKEIRTNSFLENLVVTEDKREGYPVLIQQRNQDYDTPTAERMTAAIRELLTNETPVTVNGVAQPISRVIQNLILYGIISSGSMRKGKSFSHLIPHEEYSKVIQQTFTNDDLADFYYNEGILYRTNWEDDALVPYATPNYSPVDDEPYYDRVGNSPQQKAELKRLGIDPNRFRMIAIDKWKHQDHQYVKVLEYPSYEEAPGQWRKDFRNPLITLFKQVQGTTFERVTEDGSRVKKVVFMQVQKWGTKEISEFHSFLRPSVFANNRNITDEVTEEQALKLLVGLTPKVIDEEQAGVEVKIISPEKTTEAPKGPEDYPLITEVTRSGKKTTIKVSLKDIEGNVTEMETEAYKIEIKEYPNAEMYAFKEEGKWSIFSKNIDARILAGHTTIKGAMERLLGKVNDIFKEGNPNDALKTALGLGPKTVEERFDEAKENGEIKKDCP